MLKFDVRCFFDFDFYCYRYSLISACFYALSLLCVDVYVVFLVVLHNGEALSALKVNNV